MSGDRRVGRVRRQEGPPGKSRVSATEVTDPPTEQHLPTPYDRVSRYIPMRLTSSATGRQTAPASRSTAPSTTHNGRLRRLPSTSTRPRRTPAENRASGNGTPRTARGHQRNRPAGPRTAPAGRTRSRLSPSLVTTREHRDSRSTLGPRPRTHGPIPGHPRRLAASTLAQGHRRTGRRALSRPTSTRPTG
jgi:hypothetical protein